MVGVDVLHMVLIGQIKQSHNRMRNILLTLLFIIWTCCAQNSTTLNLLTDFPYNGNILRTTKAQFYQVGMSTVPPGSYISIRFQVTTSPLLTSMFLTVSPNVNRYTLTTVTAYALYGTNYTQVDGDMDIGSMQLGKMQYINRKKIGSGVDDTLYFSVFYFDPQYRKVDANFTIYIDIISTPGVMPSCYSCVHGSGRKYLGTANCVCANCSPGFYGPDCSINMLALTSGQPTTTVVNGPGMAFFLIDQPTQITILVKQSVGMGEIYFQFINFDGEFAAYTNVAQGRNVEGRFLSTAGTSGTSFGAVSTGTKMSVTVAIYGSFPTSIEVSYSLPQKSSVLLIVLSVLGGVLFIGLIIAGIYIVRNSRWFNGGRQSRQVRPASQNLSDDQIQRFFPTVLLKNINSHSHQQQSNIQLNQNQSPQKLNISIEDCVICLCPIQMDENIKVTYCKHIFHSQCLSGWFKKQQNCPYCREEFTRTNTIKLYKKVKESASGGVILKGEDLVNAIVEMRHSAIVSKDSLESLNEKDVKEPNRIEVLPRNIQIAPRNSFEVSNFS